MGHRFEPCRGHFLLEQNVSANNQWEGDFMKNDINKTASRMLDMTNPKGYFKQVLQEQIDIEFECAKAYEFKTLDGNCCECTDKLVSYGKSEVILYFKNDSQIKKKFNNSDLNISIQKFTEIEYNKTLLDCDFDNVLQKFSIFAVNNGTNQKENKVYEVEWFVKSEDDEKKVILKDELNFKLKRGDLKLVYELNLSDNIIRYLIANNYENVYIDIMDSEQNILRNYNFTLIGEHLIYNPTAGAIILPPLDFDYERSLLISKNKNFNLEGKFRIDEEEYIGIKLNLFSEKPCKFDLVIFFKDKKVYDCDISLKIPAYYENSENDEVLMLTRRTEFMKKNKFTEFNIFNNETRVGDDLKYTFKIDQV